MKETDFSSTADKVKTSGADSVYFGGQYPEGGLLADQIKKTGANVPLMGGDGIQDPAFISASGEANEGDLATSIGYPVEKLDTAKKFIEDYKTEGYKDPYAAYGGYSYDSQAGPSSRPSRPSPPPTAASCPPTPAPRSSRRSARSPSRA